jgi:hypothetical protein
VPSGDEAALEELTAIVTNMSLDHALLNHAAALGIVLAVQEVPSDEDAPNPLYELIKKTPFPYAAPYQPDDEGIVLAVHVVPSVDDAALLDASAAATNLPPPPTIAGHAPLAGIVLAVQVIPSGDEAALVPEYAPTAKIEPFQAG